MLNFMSGYKCLLENKNLLNVECLLTDKCSNFHPTTTLERAMYTTIKSPGRVQLQTSHPLESLATRQV